MPRPPGHGELTTVGFAIVRYATIMVCRVDPQPVRKTLHVLHAQVLVSPQQGSVMEPTRGFGPGLASKPFSMVITSNSSATRRYTKAWGAGRGEDTAGEPKPRIRLPDGLDGVTRERGIAMHDLGELNPGPYRTVHHNHVSGIVWDCRNGIMQTFSYEEAPVWAQGIKGNLCRSLLKETHKGMCIRNTELLTKNAVDISKESACVATTWNVLANGQPCSV